MPTGIELVSLKDFARRADLRSDRNVRIWGEKGWITVIIHDGTRWVVLDEKAKAKIAERKKLKQGERTKKKVAKPSSSGVLETDDRAKRVAGLIRSLRKGLRRERATGSVPMQREPRERMPSELLVSEKISGTERLVKSPQLAADWVGVMLKELSEKGYGFVAIGKARYPLASSIEEIKDDLRKD